MKGMLLLLALPLIWLGAITLVLRWHDRQLRAREELRLQRMTARYLKKLLHRESLWLKTFSAQMAGALGALSTDNREASRLMRKIGEQDLGRSI